MVSAGTYLRVLARNWGMAAISSASATSRGLNAGARERALVSSVGSCKHAGRQRANAGYRLYR